MNYMETEQKLKVYYDGLCHLCYREIEHYKKLEGSSHIDFIDICGPKFDPISENLDPFAIHKVMHARLPDGTVVTRVKAFTEIWDRIPQYNLFAKLARRPWIYRGLDLGYTAFARIRPYLPKRKSASDCSDSPYCEVQNK